MVKFNELRVDSVSNKLIVDTSVLSLDYYTNVYIKKLYIHTQDTVNSIDPTSSLTNAVIVKDYGVPTIIDYDILADYIVSLTTEIPTENLKGDLITLLKSTTLSYQNPTEGYVLLNLYDNALGYTTVGGYSFSGNNIVYMDETLKDKLVPTIKSYSKKQIRELLDSSDRTDGKTDKIDMSSTMFFAIIECEGTPSSSTPCGMDNQYSMDVTIDTCPIYNKVLTGIKELNDTCNTPLNLIHNFLLFKAFLVAVDTLHFQEAINYYKKFLAITNNEPVNCKCYGGYSL